MGFEKLGTETAKTRERATPERAMIPSNEFIYIYIYKGKKSAGTVDGAARGERPPAVRAPPPGNARTEGGKWGEDKTGGGFFFEKRSRANQTDHSAPASASGACSVEAARSRSCEKVSVGNILLATARAFSLWRMVPKLWKSCV